MPQPRQGKLRRVLGLRTFFIINIVILFLVTLSFGREFVRNYEIDKEISNLEEKAFSLESQNQEILELAERLNTDDYLEQEGRMRLGLKKPGENVVIISEPEDITIPSQELSDTPTAQQKKISNPRLWWEYFFKT